MEMKVFCRLHSIKVNCNFLILLIYYCSRADVIRAKKKRHKIHCWPQRETFAFFYSLSSFSESPFIVLPHSLY